MVNHCRRRMTDGVLFHSDTGISEEIWICEECGKTVPRKSLRVEGLWLTTGGRIVKPGSGEMCSEGSDILLMSIDELEGGLKLADFELRLKTAKRNMKKKFG